MMVWLGIDLGLDGAIARLDGMPTVWDMPTIHSVRGKKHVREINIPSLLEILRTARAGGECHAILERVHSMPGQGVSSCFSFGRSTGIVEACLTALDIPYQRVQPAVWKRHYNLLHTDKEASRAEATRRFAAVDLSKKKHHGRAEALLLADFGRTQQRPQ